MTFMKLKISVDHNIKTLEYIEESDMLIIFESFGFVMASQLVFKKHLTFQDMRCCMKKKQYKYKHFD